MHLCAYVPSLETPRGLQDAIFQMGDWLETRVSLNSVGGML